MSSFKPGATVKLKSGGSKMTINKQVSEGIFECVWEGKNGRKCSEEFNADVLVEVSENKPGGIVFGMYDDPE